MTQRFGAQPASRCRRRATSGATRIGRTWLLMLTLAAVAAIGAAGCGEEHVSRAEVIDALTKNGVDRSVAVCVMEAVPQSDLDNLATADSELTPAAADRVAQVAADCAVEQVDKTTTTTATTTTTTTTTKATTAKASATPAPTTAAPTTAAPSTAAPSTTAATG